MKQVGSQAGGEEALASLFHGLEATIIKEGVAWGLAGTMSWPCQEPVLETDTMQPGPTIWGQMVSWSQPAISTTLPKGQHWTRGAGDVSSTFACRMQPCQESSLSGITPFYRWENQNMRGQITLAKTRIPNWTLTFLCKSSDRSASCNLFCTNDQMRKFSIHCFIFIFFSIFFYLNYLFYFKCWLG